MTNLRQTGLDAREKMVGKALVLAVLLCMGGILKATGQGVTDDLERLLELTEGIDENVEDLKNEIEAVGDEIEYVGINVETIAAEIVKLRQELQQQQSSTELELATLQQVFNSSLQAVTQQLIDLGRELVLPRSCSEIDPSSPSGYYTLNWNRVSVYCDMDRQSCGCGTPKGWMRVAHIDMTDSNQQCPGGFRLRSGTSPRICEIARSSGGCTSIIFPTHSVQYSRICGRVKAYQYGSVDAFETYYNHRSYTIDDRYVDGISITHGQIPRKHIWTFAAALAETSSGDSSCPCIKTSSTFNGVVPPFIGDDYFCDTGSSSSWQSRLYSDDPLWDGEGCNNSNECCQFNSPPWFCKDLPQPTTDDIEVRVCRDQGRSDEDIPFELIDLYTQ